MKLEMDHVLGIQSPPRKSYNPFDSDDEIEATTGYVKSNLNGYDIKSFETNADSLTFHLDNSDVSWEEAIFSHSQILRQSNAVDSNSEEVISRKDTELFTDKTVTECDLPELMVCYKENAFHTVKDIGIDEGMPVRDKNGSENTPAFLGFAGDINGDEHPNLSIMEGLKSMSENTLEKDVSCGKLPQDSLKDSGIDECKTDNSTDLDDVKLNLNNEKSNFSLESVVDVVDTGRESVSLRDLHLDEKSNLSDRKIEKKDQAVSEEFGDNTHSLDMTHESSTMTSKTDTSETSTESNESVYEEASSSLSPELSVLQESSESSVTNVMSYNSKVESGSIILDFNSITGAAKEKEEGETSQHIETVAEPPEAQSMSRIDENRVLESDADNRVIGETSFSAAMAPPSSITYMGPYAQSGNISLRSESSAGSTRSFAFPVLQAEWNSSPVRMAKAEHRNRKQRWVHSIMCCRF